MSPGRTARSRWPRGAIFRARDGARIRRYTRNGASQRPLGSAVGKTMSGGRPWSDAAAMPAWSPSRTATNTRLVRGHRWSLRRHCRRAASSKACGGVRTWFSTRTGVTVILRPSMRRRMKRAGRNWRPAWQSRRKGRDNAEHHEHAGHTLIFGVLFDVPKRPDLRAFSVSRF